LPQHWVRLRVTVNVTGLSNKRASVRIRLPATLVNRQGKIKRFASTKLASLYNSSAMDIFCLPKNPSRTVERAPYVCDKRYDGLPFLTYPERVNKLSSVPINLPSQAPPSVPYKEVIHPTAQPEQERFFQTWLFFGLLAEFFGLTKHEEDEQDQSGDRSAENTGSLEILYHHLVFEEGGKQYLTSAKILKVDRITGAILLKSGGDAAGPRMNYLRECLRVCYTMIHSIQTDFHHGIKYSIAALGEFLTSAIDITVQYLTKDLASPKLAFGWGRHFLENRNIQEYMLKAGWCPSDIQSARSRYLSVQTLHLCSTLDRRVFPERDHSNCNIHTCKAYQINKDDYKVGHVTGKDCECEEFTDLDIKAVVDALETKGSYPILKIDPRCTEPQDLKVEVVVYTPDTNMKYVAISHACVPIPKERFWNLRHI
jgi:hypothetical protein